jgi:hypothetical protein
MALRTTEEDENERWSSTWWGRPPWSAADALVGLMGAITEFAQRDLGVPRRPGGLPHITYPEPLSTE